MNKTLALMVGVLLLAGGGCSGAWFDRPINEPPGPKTREAVYFLTALDGSPAYDQAPQNTAFGCGDRLMLQKDSVPRTDELALVTNLNRLFSISDDEATARGLNSPFAGQGLRADVTEENGKVVVNIVGNFSSPGVCADPRIHKMVQETARFTLGSIPEIRLNGSERDWRCQGDMSGECQ